MRLDSTGLWIALFFFVLFLLLNKRFHAFYLPHFHFSRLKSLAPQKKTGQLLNFPRWLQVVAFFLFLIALSRPQIKNWKEEKEAVQELKEAKGPEVEVPARGLALYLVVDRSGSMREPVDLVTEKGARRQVSRLDLLKEITRAFVAGDPQGHFKGRSQDLIGLIAFARTAQVLTPLTFDHQQVVEELERIEPAVTREEGGTALGYALFKTVQLIVSTRSFNQPEKDLPAYELEGEVVVMVTDGFNVPNPLDKGHPYRNMGLAEAADLAKKEGVRLYLVNIEPGILRPQYRPYLSLFEETSQKTGGRFFVMRSTSELSQIFSEIEKLEEQLLPVKRKAKAVEEAGSQDFVDLFAYFLMSGFALFLFGSFLELTFLRRVP